MTMNRRSFLLTLLAASAAGAVGFSWARSCAERAHSHPPERKTQTRQVGPYRIAIKRFDDLTLSPGLHLAG